YFNSASSGEGALLNMINKEVTACPNTKLVLAGYSQGAQLTAEAYLSIATAAPSNAFDAIAGVVLFGDPQYDHADQADQIQGLTNNGVFTGSPWDMPPHAFPDNTHGKVLSYCISIDQVCQGVGQLFLHGTAPHRQYVDRGYPADAAATLAPSLAPLAGPPTYWSTAATVTAVNDGEGPAPPSPLCVEPSPCAVHTNYGLVAGGSQ